MGVKILKQKESALFFVKLKGRKMNQKNFDRKQRYGIRKFAVGVASVTIGAVVFGANPVSANEQGNSTVTTSENNNITILSCFLILKILMKCLVFYIYQQYT